MTVREFIKLAEAMAYECGDNEEVFCVIEKADGKCVPGVFEPDGFYYDTFFLKESDPDD